MDHVLLKSMLAFGVILIIGVFASKTSTKHGIPALLLFIIIGMISGSEGFGGIFFDDAHLAHNIGTIALILILFSGGLSTHKKVVMPVWREGVVLAFGGVLLSTGVMAFLIRYLIGWEWKTAALLGATISSTDAAAVFGILKTRHLGLKPNIQAVIELESGSNDPMAVFLTLSLIQVILMPASFAWPDLLQSFFIQMSLGGLAGWFCGRGMVYIINWLDLEFEGLYPVLTLATVISLYALTQYCGGNGFLSVYLMGLTMCGEKYFSKKALEVFHDGIAWLMQVGMFLMMGLLVYPSEIPAIMGVGTLIALGLMFVARPLSVFICLAPFKYSWKEMLFISWGGLRGAVPIILATYFLVSQVPNSTGMFNVVFFIVIISLLVQGTGLGRVAKWLGIQLPHIQPKRLPFKSRTNHRDFIEFEISQTSPLIGKTILDIKFPEDTLVVLIHREEKDFIPRGNTELQVFDRLVCLVDKSVLPELEKVLRPTLA